MHWFVLLLAALFAVLLGGIAALMGGVVSIILFVPILPVLFIFRDYKVGVVALTLLLPWYASPLLPQTQGFNIINYLIAATLLSFLLRAAFSRKIDSMLPRVFVWCYLVPVTIALVLAIPHLATAARNFAGQPDALLYEPFAFLKTRYLKPLGYVIFAWLLANAVRESKNPRRWVGVMAISALLPAIGVFTLIAVQRVGLSDLQAQRNFLGPLGMHANELGFMLAMAFGPLLFAQTEFRGVVARTTAAIVLMAVGMAAVFTFSRGAFLALCTVYGLFLVSRRKITTLVISIIVIGAAALLAPDAVRERLSTGLQSGAVRDSVNNLNDPLTAGRVAVWQALLPEVLRSPLWGRGIGSTAWSDLVSSGKYGAYHPHNFYLEVLLDMGLAGLVALTYLYFRYFKALRNLSDNQDVDPLLRRFFAGAGAGLAGILVMSFTNGHYMPHAEQSFVWFCLGLLFAHWSQAQVSAVTVTQKSRKKGFGMRAAPDLSGRVVRNTPARTRL